MISVDDPAFADLARKISAGVGLTLDVYKDKCIRRRIAVRMRACGVESYTDYGLMLDRSPEEFARLKDTLTINVTRFYRNAEMWRVLRDIVIPALCARERGDLHIWSAGCSSGEEAYTAVMLFADHFRELGCEDRLASLNIDATDVDRASLEQANAGRYRANTLAETPAPYITRYFTQAATDYVIDPTLRARVRVSYHDLSRDPPPRRGYHLILCRNVVIYFDRSMQERLFVRFAEALAPSGYLVLGKVETLLGPARERLAVVESRERVFQRPS